MLSKKMIAYINGMSCAHCAKSVQDAIKEIDNVKSVKVSLEKKNATITYKDNIDVLELRKKIEDLGYEFIGVNE